MVRIKHRYLLVNILYPDAQSSTPGSSTQNVPDFVQFRRPTRDTVEEGVLINAIRKQLTSLFGDYGSGVTGGSIRMKYFSNATSTCILQCPREHFRLVWAAISFITQIPIAYGSSETQDCVMRVVHNSGTIRKAEEEAIRRARADILRAQGEGGDTEEPSEVNMLNEIFGSGSNKAPQLDEADDTDDSGMEVDENTELDTAHHK